jgi:hypothetical protein
MPRICTRQIFGSTRLFIKTNLNEILIKNRDDCESNHNIVAVGNLQYNLYNVNQTFEKKQYPSL